MPVEGITSTQDIGIYVDDRGQPQLFETPGGRGQPAQAEVTYITRWEHRYDVYEELLGGFAQLNGLGVPTPGHAYPPSPNLSCESIGRVDPHGIDRAGMGDGSPEAMAARRWLYPKWCLIPCTYRPIDYAYSSETANESNQIDPSEPIVGCRQRVEGNNTFVVVDNATMEILATPIDDEEPARQSPPKVVQSTDGLPANSVAFTLEYPRVPRNPWPWLRPFLGRVNRFPMFGLPAGHVLFASVATDTTFAFAGPQISCTLTYLGNLDVAWNETIDDDGVVKAKVFHKSAAGGGTSYRFPFPSADLMIPLR